MCPLSIPGSFYGNGCFAIVSITDTGAHTPTRETLCGPDSDSNM